MIIVFNRDLNYKEINYIIQDIWGFELDFNDINENDEYNNLYSDVINVILGNISFGEFASEWIGEDVNDITFDYAYNTLEYLIKNNITITSWE